MGRVHHRPLGGHALETTTTHLKWGWIRRNGVIASDQATVMTRYVRHGDVLTITVVVSDPMYLTEPYVKTIDFIPLGAAYGGPVRRRRH